MAICSFCAKRIWFWQDSVDANQESEEINFNDSSELPVHKKCFEKNKIKLKEAIEKEEKRLKAIIKKQKKEEKSLEEARKKREEILSEIDSGTENKDTSGTENKNPLTANEENTNEMSPNSDDISSLDEVKE